MRDRMLIVAFVVTALTTTACVVLDARMEQKEEMKRWICSPSGAGQTSKCHEAR